MSSTNKNIIPKIKPIVAGKKLSLPILSDKLIAGINKDHIEAAIITPEAKPNKYFSNLLLILFFKKNTNEEPNVVPIKGIIIPITKR